MAVQVRMGVEVRLGMRGGGWGCVRIGWRWGSMGVKVGIGVAVGM